MLSLSSPWFGVNNKGIYVSDCTSVWLSPSGGSWVLDFRIFLFTEENLSFLLETWTLFLMYSQCLGLDLASPCPLVFSGSSSPSYLVEEPSAFSFPSQLGLLISGHLAKSYPSQPTDVSLRLGEVRIQVGFSPTGSHLRHWPFFFFSFFYGSKTCTL